MQQCSICLDDLEGGPTLACGHRFHAACLARLAGANGTTPTRRGALRLTFSNPPAKTVEGARQKKNGKWTNPVMFPGRDFDDLDAYRAAKKQRSARRAAYLDQIPEWQKK